MPGTSGLTIYQVKSFTGKLTPSRKGQIRKSLDTFTRTVATTGMQVAEWLLVRPEDPTPQDNAWLAKETTGLPFTCRWRGLTWCDALAARYPHVIDYYVGDGRTRLEDSLAKFAMAFGGSLPTSPGDAEQRLRAMS